MEPERLITREELVPAKYKKIWASKEERDAWEAHVDETLRRLRTVLEKAQAELDARQQP